MAKIVERTNDSGAEVGIAPDDPEMGIGAGIPDDADKLGTVDELEISLIRVVLDIVSLFDKLEVGAARSDEEAPATGPW